MNRTRARRAVVVPLIVASLVACEKAHDAQDLHPLDAADKALFASLPAGQSIYWGGDYARLQDFMQSSLGQASAAVMEQVGSGMGTWMKCFRDLSHTKFGGSVGFDAMGAAEMRIVMSGISLDELARCGEQASFKTAFDADHKFLVVELPAPAAKAGYLLLPNGSVYMREGFVLGLAPQATSPSRAELEDDLTKLATANAADDARLAALVGKVDRARTVWFVGDAANTPIADKLGEAWGTIDLASGLAIDVTIQVKHPADADKAEQGIAQVRKMVDSVPDELKGVLKDLVFERHGDHLRFADRISDAAIQGLMSKYGSLLGAGLKH